MTELPNELKLEALLSTLPAFKPLAYYDKHLDAIRVQILDCSIWEERCDRIMTIYHMNHHPKPDGINDVVGFAIKGIGYLLNKVGMNPGEAVQIAEFLSKLVKLYPTESTKRVAEFYRQQGTDMPQSVELKEAA